MVMKKLEVLFTMFTILMIGFNLSQVLPSGFILPSVQLQNLGPGTWAYSYLYGEGLISLEVDYESGYEPSSSAIDYLVQSFNQISCRTLIFDNESTTEFEPRTYNPTIIRNSRNSSDTFNHMYVYYSSDDNITTREGGPAGGLALDSSTIVLDESTKDDIFVESNRLLHELGHLLSLWHPYYSPNIHHEPAFECVMSPSRSDEALQTFCLFCRLQLGNPRSIELNIHHWLEYSQDLINSSLRQESRMRSRDLVYRILTLLLIVDLIWAIFLFYLGYNWVRRRQYWFDIPT